MKTIPYPEAATDWRISTETHYTPANEVSLLCWLIAQVPGDILEIGCSRGWTTQALALAFPDRIIHAVDWTGNHELSGPQALEKPEIVAEIACHLPNVRTYNMNSHLLPYPEGVGFIFIDGDHSLEGVRGDSERAFLYARSHDVIIAWHDYSQLFYINVVDYLDSLSEQGCHLLHIEGTMVAFSDFAHRPDLNKRIFEWHEWHERTVPENGDAKGLGLKPLQ
jgi:hypothetical protein